MRLLRSFVASTDFAIFSAVNKAKQSVSFLFLFAKNIRRTESHELRANRHTEHHKIEDLNHLKVGVRSPGNENGPNIEKERFSEVNEAT